MLLEYHLQLYIILKENKTQIMKNIDKVDLVVKIACVGFIALCSILVLADMIINGSNM